MPHGARTRTPQRGRARDRASALRVVPAPPGEPDPDETGPDERVPDEPGEALAEDAPVEALDEEPDGEPGEEEAAVEAEVASEEEEVPADEASDSDAVVEVLLRRTGVLPPGVDLEDRDEEGALPPPRRSDEFVCSGCFLIKTRLQLGDAEHNLCRDCADEAPAPQPRMQPVRAGRGASRRIA